MGSLTVLKSKKKKTEHSPSGLEPQSQTRSLQSASSSFRTRVKPVQVSARVSSSWTRALSAPSSPLLPDDGGGMTPEAMRRCISFGFSDKNSKTTIGQYGNGFKTSSMRFGADVIVFSRSLGDRRLTQSVGLLSYTFLMQTGQDRIVVPMDMILQRN